MNNDKPAAYLMFYVGKNPDYGKAYTSEEIQKLVDIKFDNQNKYHEPNRTTFNSKDQIKAQLIKELQDSSMIANTLEKVSILTKEENSMLSEVEARENFLHWFRPPDFTVK